MKKTLYLPFKDMQTAWVVKCPVQNYRANKWPDPVRASDLTPLLNNTGPLLWPGLFLAFRYPAPPRHTLLSSFFTECSEFPPVSISSITQRSRSNPNLVATRERTQRLDTNHQLPISQRAAGMVWCRIRKPVKLLVVLLPPPTDAFLCSRAGSLPPSLGIYHPNLLPLRIHPSDA